MATKTKAGKKAGQSDQTKTPERTKSQTNGKDPLKEDGMSDARAPLTPGEESGSAFGHFTARTRDGE